LAKVVRVHELGGPETLVFEEMAVGAPGPGEVRIRVEAVGLNRSEAMFRAGRYPTKPALPTLIGYEACGIVEALGEGVEGFAVGERVSALPMYPLGTYGVWAEQAIVPARCLLPAPEGLTPAEAAAVWMQYMTAFAIIEVGEASIGDYVIIPAASSSVGLAAIQLANWAGAVPIAATRTSAKADQLKALGAAHVIATQESDLVAEVMRITDGKGARLVFDPVQGPYVQTLTSAMAERGILFIYGGLSEQPTPYRHWNMAFKGLSMRGWVASEIWNHPHRYKAAQARIRLGLRLGHLRPVIAKSFPFAEIVEANRFLESNQQIGKVVVTM